MPVFNGVPYLKDAIDSVLSQSYKNFEFLIIDDGSTEDVSSIIKSYKDSRIKFLSRENRGLGSTLNELASMAASEYIFRMDADDICEITRFEKQISLMLADPDIVMCGGGVRYIVGTSYLPAFSPVLGDRNIKYALQQGRFPICHPAIVFRKSAFLRIGGYRLGGAGEDLDFFLRMSEIGKVENVNFLVLNYRITAGSLALKKSAELEKGYSYALFSANLRRHGELDVSYSDYINYFWPKRSFIEVVSARARTISERYYRGYLIDRADGRFFLACSKLMVAALLRINAVFSRLNQKLQK